MERQSSSSLSPTDYTIAWICALPIELAAATAMLDLVHEALPKSSGDTNTYTLGTVGVHHVVIACLPSGYYGTNTAATVASNLRRSFPAVHSCLMVGIGGGVPGPVDLRLGDVVVGHKIVQYDLGKTVAGENFIRTSTPIRPSLGLLTAVAKLRARHALEPSRVPSILAEMIQKYPSMLAYTYPTQVSDRLFQATYNHMEPARTCEQCDPSRLVQRGHQARSTTGPQIHHGAIASGNQVMKDGATRNRIAQDLGAICFEMEAAGLADSFPCLAVRGICDYSDSHKNDQWQEYAAATAAAYTKELMSVIPASGPGEAQRDHYRSPDSDRRKNLLEILRFDYIDARRSAIKPHHSDTCRWLLTHPDYLEWLDMGKAHEHYGFLWIRGKPGAGKSTLMNFAYSQALMDKANTVISFFFNARGDSLERSSDGMYRSLLHQLLHQVPRLQQVFDLPEHVRELDGLNDTFVNSKAHCHIQPRLLQDLRRSVVKMLDQERLVVFIDALDECDEYQVGDMVEVFEELGKRAFIAKIRLLTCFSSRHYPHIDIEHGRKMTLE